jgi:hypothetical protein
VQWSPHSAKLGLGKEFFKNKKLPSATTKAVGKDFF